MDNKISKTKLRRDNFIIIAPEGYTHSELPKEFWQKLIYALKEKGFDIYINVTNKKNIIKGCKHADLNYSEVFCLAKEAKAVISLKSGFSEFMLACKIPNIAIYTKFRKITKNACPTEKVMAGFSMLKLPFVNKNLIKEINYENYNNDEALISDIINFLERLSSKEV